MSETITKQTSITSYQVPLLNQEQLKKFNRASIHATKVMDFDPRHAVKVLDSHEGARIIGADFGGDKGVSQLFDVVSGELKADDSFRAYKQSTGGEGYADVFRETEAFAARNDIKVGVSWGAPLNGAKPLYHPKAKLFLEELSEKYEGDLTKITPHISAVMNDGPAGLVSGAVEAYRQFGATDVLFPINGGGLGMAVLKDGVLYATEAGHVEALPELNTYDRIGECGVFDETYVCIEMLGANKAGIERQWYDLTGENVRARNIETLFLEGNELAGKLYDNSAWIVAHMIAGTAEAFGINLSSPTTAVVGHGGGFKFPNYGDRVMQILSAEGLTPQLIMTKDFGNKETNACLDGAAIAALVAQG